MSELKPCPFCGGEAGVNSIRRDKRKRLGIYHMIVEIKCIGINGIGCTATISQAGATEEKAYENAARIWNRRANNELQN